MGSFLNIGNDGFQAITKDRYVDKTILISFINKTLGTKRKFTCVTRPRRFGKSYAAQMLCAYYSRDCDSRSLFAPYAIARDSSFETYLNKLDVIYLDLTRFTARGNIEEVVFNIEKQITAELAEAYPDVPGKEKLADMLESISVKTKRKFMLIIDEWDAIFREAQQQYRVQKEYIEFLRELFKDTSRTDKMIEGVYMTGILPIKKYGTQSALTDFKEYSMTLAEPLEEYVGFTENEVKRLCEESELDFSEVQKWYDGYLLGRKKHIYNPKSVMEAVERKRIGNYWTRSETYESLKLYIDLDYDGLKEALLQMLGGAKIKIRTLSFQNDMTSLKSRDDVLTLLIHLGYLAYDAETQCVFVPNEEIRQEFLLAVEMGKHQELARLIRNSDQLLMATLDLDEETVASCIEAAHLAGTSPLHYNDEQALRSTIRVAYISSVDEFIKIEELPSGRGFADVVFLPKRTSTLPAMIIELKWEKSADGALAQIKKKYYPEVLKNFGGDILLVGVNYNTRTGKHTCRIEKEHAIKK